ncbi:unnamed protein product, partial [Callosobruchus maculatus]
SSGAGDDVQRSIELLDRVLSEFDDVENANQVQNIHQISTSTSSPHIRSTTAPTVGGSNAATPSADEDSPPGVGGALGAGHQSEDDGYMSMNGRRQRDRHKYAAAAAAAGFGAVQEHQEAILRGRDEVDDDFPPPPEEAQRLIATLLPKVSPSHRPKLQNIGRYGQNRSFPLTQLSPRSECIPPPHNFQNSNGLVAIQDQTHTATQTTLPKTKHQRP